MKSKHAKRIKTIAEFHKLWGLPKPEHPLISIVDYSKFNPQFNAEKITFDCYSIAVKRGVDYTLKYGQQKYDFDEGVMFFAAPNQVISVDTSQSSNSNHSGWILFIHPDFLWNTPLAKSIKQYEFFNYAVNEALFLSEKEEAMINNIIENIKKEYHSNIDKFSQNIIISQIETILNYSERFYQRQFITRKITNHKILDRLEEELSVYFGNDDLITKGLPTVQFLAGKLNISPGYLSGLLKVLTGQNTHQHIQNKVIEKAKEKLSTTDLSVGEIAYELGFEHPQSFSKLFKTKTNLSPSEFRQSFN